MNSKQRLVTSIQMTLFSLTFRSDSSNLAILNVRNFQPVVISFAKKGVKQVQILNIKKNYSKSSGPV